ncbi:LxmA leader domain family RiPP, partial [Streptomyces sp. NPDC008265]
MVRGLDGGSISIRPQRTPAAATADPDFHQCIPRRFPVQNVTEKDLFDGYTAYTSAEELGLHDGATAGP